MSDELRLESRPSLNRPILVTAFRGWNDGGQGASLAAQHLVNDLGCGEVRRHRPRGLLRLPGDAAAGLARRRPHAADRLARERLLPREPRRRARRRDARRHGAEHPLADVHRARGRAGARARHRPRREPRRAAGGRPAHAPGARHRRGLGPGARRAARPPGVALRGADGDRRRAPRRVPGAGHRRP